MISRGNLRNNRCHRRSNRVENQNYEIEVENDQLVGVLSRCSINKRSRNVTLLSYQNHVCYTKDLNAVFNCFRCKIVTSFSASIPICDVICQFVVKKSEKNSQTLRTNWKKQCSKNIRSLELQFLKIADYFSKISQFLISNHFAWLTSIPSQPIQLHGWVGINHFPYEYLLTFSKLLSFYVIHNRSKW